MGAGNSSQGKVVKSNGPVAKGAGGAQSPDKTQKVPEINIRTITWTRESHGLFDFEIKETERKLYEKKQFKLKGSHRVYRAESEVSAEFVG